MMTSSKKILEKILENYAKRFSSYVFKTSWKENDISAGFKISLSQFSVKVNHKNQTCQSTGIICQLFVRY